jgi:hypothetical protein
MRGLAIGIAAIAVAVAVAAGAWYAHSPPASASASAPAPPPRTETAVDKPKPSRSPYDRYILTARKNGWEPADPVEKIGSTLAKLGQVLAPGDLGGSGSLLQMLTQEFSYVLNVLTSTHDRTFDLSHLMPEALEMMKIAHFKILKHLLRSGQSVVTRADVDGRAEARLLQAALGQTLLAAATPREPSNIIFDLSRRDRRGASPLMLAVRYRLHAMAAWLQARGCSCLQDDSLREALLNGDGAAAGMLLPDALLAASAASEDPLEAARLPTLLRAAALLAEELQYPNLRALLQSKLEALAAASGGGAAAEAKGGSGGNDFHAVRATDGCVADSGSAGRASPPPPPPAATAASAPGEGEVSAVLPCAEPAAGVGAGAGAAVAAASLPFDVRHRCDIAVHRLAGGTGGGGGGAEDITIGEFRERFVRRNRPAVLRGLLGTDLGEWRAAPLCCAVLCCAVSVSLH